MEASERRGKGKEININKIFPLPLPDMLCLSSDACNEVKSKCGNNVALISTRFVYSADHLCDKIFIK